jgi:acyl-coenzyme A synthetase/AMP-(fatty) acid ligase
LIQPGRSAPHAASALVQDDDVPWIAAPDVPIDKDGPDLAFRPFDPANGPETPIRALLAAQAEAMPDQIAVQDDENRLTYRDLFRQANGLANSIAGIVPAGQPVGIRLQDTVHGPVALLACVFAATPAVLLDRTDPPERLAIIATASRLGAIVTDQELPGQRCISPHSHAAASFSGRALAQDAPAFVIWTSGSTGQPKGIVHSQRSVLHRAGLLVNSGHLNVADRYLSLNTPASMGALLNAMAAWLAGATLHRIALPRQGLAGVLRRIREDHVTAVIGVPAIYRALARPASARSAMSSLRLLSSNGDALLAADLALLRQCLAPTCHIQMVYGATETQAGLRFIPGNEVPVGAQVAAGRPIPGTQFTVLRDDGSAAAVGEPGELMIRSRYTAIGEWQDGRCIPGRLPHDGQACSGWRRYAMGDIVRLRRDGAFHVVGRSDRQFKMNGHRVEPVELEAALRGDSAVLDSVVLPIPGPMGAELVAFVAIGRAKGKALTPRLLAMLAARAPVHMLPQRLHCLPALPLLPSNKIDALALRRLDAARMDTV